MSNYLNWPASLLREKLTGANINTSLSFPISVLRKLYVDNVLNTEATARSTASEVVDGNNVIGGNTANDSPDIAVSSHPAKETDNSHSVPVHSEAFFIPNNPSTTCQNETTVMAPNLVGTPGVVNSLINTVQSLQTMVSSLASMVTSKETNANASFSLQNYYHSNAIQSPPSQTARKFGTNPEDLPQMDLISPSIRKNIVEGKDINLATLLIPYYEVHTSEKEKEKEDLRLKRNLTIAEFLTAFGKYKRVMCQAFPNRRDELDSYEANIIDIYNVYGERFYEYHKLFSLRSANALTIHRIKVDWSAKDRDLIQLISSRARSCAICSEVSHDTKFCPSYNKTDIKSSNATDRHGRKRTSYNGSEICNNFNSSKSCNRNNCPYQHICVLCKSKDHSAITCSQTSSKTKPNHSTQSSRNRKEEQ